MCGNEHSENYITVQYKLKLEEANWTIKELTIRLNELTLENAILEKKLKELELPRRHMF